MSSPDSVFSTHRWQRYVAIGDSFTQGFGDPSQTSPGGYRGWADRVAEVLGKANPDFDYANLAIQGLGVRDVIDSQLDKALALEPDLVSFQAGGNDLIKPSADLDKLAALIEPALRKILLTGATVLLFIGPDSGPHTVLGLLRARVATFNENLRSIAKRLGVLVVDLWALRALHDPHMWDTDRLHLSRTGHACVSALVLSILGETDPGVPLKPAPQIPLHWREARAQDLVWTGKYLIPWLLRAASPYRSPEVPAAKLPRPEHLG